MFLEAKGNDLGPWLQPEGQVCLCPIKVSSGKKEKKRKEKKRKEKRKKETERNF